ncbi:MAG: efflux RND transporter periplasmic adaptor subunit [Armatimonadota bacterium]|nr:efflux RND transporter periplasmic adaptor subunit [Armatimonadota bacterium]MCX7777317.1 efflux RND transporter periplasmic adaptor subunit [Armatimonadota bacterium]MDW8024366.1 efflux RND transporter periplasmic adaptor subunit [Armatimonadota bacterium]
MVGIKRVCSARHITQLLIAFAIIALSLIGMWRMGRHRTLSEGQLEAAGEKGTEAVPVEVVPVSSQDIRREIEVTGSIKSEDDVNVGSEISGKVAFVGAEEGDFVRAGDVLIRLDDSTLQAQLRQAKAAYESAMAQYEQLRLAKELEGTKVGTDLKTAQAQLSTAQARARELKVALELTEKETGISVEQAKANLEAAKAFLSQAEEQAKIADEQAETELKRAEAALRAARERLAMAEEGVGATDEQVEAQVQQAQAQLASAKALFDKARKGARTQEREQARQAVAQARANFELAQAEFERAKFLYERGAISRSQLDQAKQLYEVAKANYESAKQMLSLVEEGTRPEDIRAAEEAVKQAEAGVKLAEAARVKKSTVRRELEIAKAQLAEAEALYNLAKVSMARKRISALQVESARVQVKNAELALQLAKEGERRRQMLKEQLEAALAAVKQAEALVELASAGNLRVGISRQQVEAARAAVDSARAQVQSLETQLVKTKIRAPISGYVAERRVDVGETVIPGMPLLRLVSMERIYFEGELPEIEYESVSNGRMRVTVRVDSVPGMEFEGYTERIIPVAIEATRKFVVRVKLMRLHQFIIPGSFARGRMMVEEIRGAIVIPSACILRDREKSYVFVVEQGVAKRREVKLGIEVGEKIQVVDGLNVGELIVISGQDKLHDGARVRIIRKRNV